MQTVQVVLVPIDSRPVTYSFPQQVAAIAGLDVLAPPLEMMGSLEEPADRDGLNLWLEQSLTKLKPDVLVVCLDSLFYGGLVASRRSSDPVAEIMERAKRISGWKKLSEGKTKILAQASVMRIPHYNTSTTEPAYWQEYGEQIFKWSALKHQEQIGTLSINSELKSLENQIPKAVLDEFLLRRERNFTVNQSLIDMAASAEIDYLVFSQDDTAQYGLNVLEKTRLEAEAKSVGANNVVAYAGTDETILALLARWLIATSQTAPKASVQYSPNEGQSVISRFEGQTIGRSLLAVANVMGLDVASATPSRDDDLAVIVHTAGDSQGDHLAAQTEKIIDTANTVRNTLKLIEHSNVPVVLCDVAYSNGADPLLIDALLGRKELVNKLCGYAGWNTTNNTIGSAVAMGVASWYTRLHKVDRHEDSKRALFVRLVDDWAYQARVRPQLAGKAADEPMQLLMAPFLKVLAEALAFDPSPVTLKLPWKRTFEVEVGLPSVVKNGNIAR